MTFLVFFLDLFSLEYFSLINSANLNLSTEVMLTCKNASTGTVMPPLMMTVVIVMTQVVVKNS